MKREQTPNQDTQEKPSKTKPMSISQKIMQAIFQANLFQIEVLNKIIKNYLSINSMLYNISLNQMTKSHLEAR